MLRVAAVLALLAAAAAQAPSQSELTSFLSWFNARGGQAPKLTLAPFKGMGVGVAAVEAVAEGDVAIVVPLDTVACRDTILSSSSKAIQDQLSPIESDEQLIATFLVQQRALGEASAWSPYIQALPKSIPLTFTLSDAELNEFQDPAAVATAKSRRFQISSDFNSLLPAITSVLRFSGVTSPDALPLKEWYFHAVTVVDSRALTIRGLKYLVPFADMFNYAPHDTAREADRGNHFLKYHILGKTHFTVLADRIAEPGQQLFEDYGDNDNSIYVHHHGFVPYSNPFDCIPLVLPELKKNDRNLQSKRTLAQQAQLNSGMYACVRPGDSSSIPRRVLDWFYLVSMTSTGLTKCEPFLNNEKTRHNYEKCFGNAFSPDSLKRLLDTLKGQATVFTSDPAQDAALLAGSELTGGTRLAVAYRAARKALLQRILSDLQGVVSPTSVPVPSPPKLIGKLDLSTIVDNFNAWFKAGNPPVAAIHTEVAPEGMRLGAYASRAIAAEEPYLSVPLALIMDLDSAYRSSIRPMFLDLKKRFKNGDPFHELLFHLLYEKFELPLLGKASFWRPYLDTLPTAEELDFPVFYSPSELDELQASDTKAAIIKYQSDVQRKFTGLSKIMRDYSMFLDESVFTFENYRWAHAILDSRAIWWGGERHLVPMLDLINCKEGPNPQRVHKTALDAEGLNAVTNSPWAFATGEQFFENYGQPNHIYFTYHGFVLDSNTHDCVSVRLGIRDSDPVEVQQDMEARLNAADYPLMYAPCLTAASVSSKETQYLQIAYGPDANASAVLLDIVRAKLAAYATSAAEDAQLLSIAKGKSWRFIASVKLRLSEKRLLADIAKSLQAPKDSQPIDAEL